MNRILGGAIFVAVLGAMLWPVSGIPSAAAATSNVSSRSSKSRPVAVSQSKHRAPTQDIKMEESGDPDAPVEVLTVNEVALENVLKESHALSAFPVRKRRYKDARNVAMAMLNNALKYANQSPPVSRKTSPGEIRKFVSLFDYPSENVPFCAMGIAYVASKAYCDTSPQKITYSSKNDASTFQKVLPLMKSYYFTPSPSCRIMLKEAKKKRFGQRGSWVEKGRVVARPAWLVIFDWKKGKAGRDGVPDHVGIVYAVDANDSDKVHTVEFNTSIRKGNQSNGGAVARKVRSMSDIMGFIKTY